MVTDIFGGNLNTQGSSFLCGNSIKKCIAIRKLSWKESGLEKIKKKFPYHQYLPFIQVSMVYHNKRKTVQV